MFHIFLIALLAFGGQAFGHSGRLNSEGCHAGSRPYHCHRSPSQMVPSSTGGYRLKCSAGSQSKDCKSQVPIGTASEKIEISSPKNSNRSNEVKTTKIGIFETQEVVTCYTHATAFVDVYTREQMNKGASFNELKEDKMIKKGSLFSGLLLGYVAILDEWDISTMQGLSASFELSPISQSNAKIESLTATKKAGDLSLIALGNECSLLAKILLKDLKNRSISLKEVQEKYEKILKIMGQTPL